jgi:hypothetical protein
LTYTPSLDNKNSKFNLNQCKNAMKKIIVILMIFLCITSDSFSFEKYKLACNSKLLYKSREILIGEIGVREKSGRNDGPKIEAYLASVGLKKGLPYCAAGQYWCFERAAELLGIDKSAIPLARTGLANSMFNAAQKGKKVRYKPEKDDLVVWKSINSFNGHIERIIETGKAGWTYTVGFNTSGNCAGSQNEGEGVFKKRRNVYQPISRLMIRGLIGFEKY